MTHRPCLNCGTLTPHTRCTHCRPTTHQRGYGHQHQTLRNTLRQHVDTGQATCWRCHQPIHPGTPWHLGHDDHDRTVYKGPEHARCNITAANRLRRGLSSDAEK